MGPGLAPAHPSLWTALTVSCIATRLQHSHGANMHVRQQAIARQLSEVAAALGAASAAGAATPHVDLSFLSHAPLLPTLNGCAAAVHLGTLEDSAWCRP
jgi:hypothetical protein